MKNSNIFCNTVAIASLVLVGLVTPAQSQDANLVDNICLGCICEAASGCDLSRTCTGDVCGLFRINWLYWAKSGRRTVNGEFADTATAYENCAFDPDCATEAVQNYIQTFIKDCNGDNKIDCWDYASVHKLGPYGCPGRISGNYARKLYLCLETYGVYDTDTEYSAKVTEQRKQINNSTQNSEKVPQITGTVKLQKIIDENDQVIQIEDFVQIFNHSTGESRQSNKDFLEVPSDKKVIRPETILPNEDTSISAEVDIVSRFGDEDIPSIPDQIVGNQLKRRATESSQDRLFNILDRMEKSENDRMARKLEIENKILEAFLETSRIEEERNKILRAIAKKNKRSDLAPNYSLL